VRKLLEELDVAGYEIVKKRGKRLQIRDPGGDGCV
jgi:hypothetical protein